MPKRESVRIQHMIDAGREALGFVHGRSFDQLAGDRMLFLALLKCIEIIGEAAANIVPETRARHAAIPWQEIVGMRNRLVHVYFDIDERRVWETVTADIAPLIEQLEGILATEPEEPPGP